MTHYSNRVIVTDRLEDLQRLPESDVMGVVLRGAWSEGARRFAEAAAHDRQHILMHEALKNRPGPDAQAFFDDQWKFVRKLASLGAQFAQTPNVYDFSRVELAMQPRHGSNRPHVDKGIVAFLSILYGTPTLYPEGQVEGDFNDIFFQPGVAEELVICALPENSILFFKCEQFPFGARPEHGLIHIRNDTPDTSELKDLSRFVVHQKAMPRIG